MLELTIFFAIITLGGSFIRKRIPNASLCMVILLAMWVLCAFRGFRIGVDTSMYLSIYSSMRMIESYTNEPLFYLIVKTCQAVGTPNEWVQVLMATITYVPLMALLATRSRNACLSAFVMIISVNGYFFETFNIVRQWSATSFLLWAYVWLDEKEWKKAVVAMVIAVGLHLSSLIFIPFALLAYKIKFGPKFVYISLAVSFLFALVISNIRMITDLVGLAAKMGLFGTEKYEYFTDYRLDMAKTINGMITLLLPFSGLCAYAYRRFRDRFTMRLFFLGCFFLNLVAVMPTSYRMAFGMTCIEILLYPIVFSTKMKYKFVPVLILAFTVLFWAWKLEETLKLSQLEPYMMF